MTKLIAYYKGSGRLHLKNNYCDATINPRERITVINLESGENKSIIMWFLKGDGWGSLYRAEFKWETTNDGSSMAYLNELFDFRVSNEC